MEDLVVYGGSYDIEFDKASIAGVVDTQSTPRESLWKAGSATTEARPTARYVLSATVCRTFSSETEEDA